MSRLNLLDLVRKDKCPRCKVTGNWKLVVIKSELINYQMGGRIITYKCPGCEIVFEVMETPTAVDIITEGSKYLSKERTK
jgi:hypothetical protein